MHHRSFSFTGRNVSEIGLGCWQLGGGDWGDLDEDRAFEILNTAVDNGIDFLDTADVYGGGRSESLIGRFLKTRSESLFVATKLGRNGIYPDKYTATAVRETTEASLQRLGVETLDLTQLHCVPHEILKQGDIFEWLRDLQKEGKIRHFGASVESMDEARTCLEQEGLASLQIIFNIFRQKPLEKLLPAALEKKVAIIVRLPLASGLLAGKLTRNTQFPDNDHRKYNRDGQAFNVGETFAGLPFEKGVELADQLAFFVPSGMSMAAMAQRWLLDQPAVTTVITGASKPAQAAANAAISHLPPLGPALHEKLHAFYTQKVAGLIRGPY